MHVCWLAHAVVQLPHGPEFYREEGFMLGLALTFLIIALIAGALGLFNVAAVSSQVAWILFVVFIILFLVSLIFGGIRRAPPL
jgi:uncharacterized membrane protein YtjA (UPF0391 family)